MIRMQFDETVASSDGGCRFVGFVMCVGSLDLGLLRIGAVRVARFQLFVELYGLLVVAFVKRFFRRGVQLVGRPAFGRVRVFLE